MSSKTIETGLFSGTQHRSAKLDKAGINREARTVTLSFSSETEVERGFGAIEILDHSPESVDLTRLQEAGPLLLDHNTRDQVGVVERVWIDQSAKKGRAVVRFGRSARADEVFQDVVDGVRQLVSVGYTVQKVKDEQISRNKKNVYRVTRWTPMELSLVSVPADPTVGVGRSQETQNPPPKARMPEDIEVNEHEDIPERGTRRAEAKRITEISGLATHFGFTHHLNRWIQGGASPAEVRAEILEKKFKPIPAPQIEPMIGMSSREVREYSITRAISQLANNQHLDGLEREASEAVAQKTGRKPNGFFIPADVTHRSFSEARGLNSYQMRANSAGSALAGGFTVGTDVLGSSMIELMRNAEVFSQVGATYFSGLVGNVAIPKQTGGVTAYWLSETATATDSQATFGQLALTPHRCTGTTPFTKQLLAQSSIDIEGFVRGDLMKGIATARDLAFLNGTGNAGQPLGVMRTTNVNSITFGGAPTWAKVVQFETEVKTDNHAMGRFGYVVSPAVNGKWKTTEVASSTGNFIMPLGATTCNGYPIAISNQVPDNRVIFGNWADLIIADWEGMDVVVDPYTLAKSHQVQVTVTVLSDCGARYPTAFCVSSDSGAQ